ncbi:MAG: hypothetical protein ING75_13395 [Rhodocyclaceae bacterium]|nr:hypothetical protein [Rhodocyclaceae bacterium]
MHRFVGILDGFGPRLKTRYGEQYLVDPIAGIDIGHDHGPLDFQSVRAAGRQLVCIEASDTMTLRHPTYSQNRVAERPECLSAGCYPYCRTANSADKQFSICDGAASVARTDILAALDGESRGNRSTLEPRDLARFVSSLGRNHGAQPSIYSSTASTTTHRRGFSAIPLLAADYTSDNSTARSSDWTARQFWQYSERGKVAGNCSGTDLDWLRGNLQGLHP